MLHVKLILLLFVYSIIIKINSTVIEVKYYSRRNLQINIIIKLS